MTIPRSSRSFLLPLLFALASCATEPAPDWRAPRLQDHPLAGVIHDVRRDRTVSRAALQRRLREADVALLGEKHDNPDHHALRGSLLSALLDEGQVSLVSMEMLTAAQQARVDRLPPDMAGEDARLNEALNWESGWHWPFYRPVLQDVLARDGVRLRAGNLDTSEVMEIYQEELPETGRQVLDESRMQRLHEDVLESHCGQLPDDQIPAMVRIQQARDQAMADSLQLPGREQEKLRVLLAGNYHIRRDVGVPAYLPGDTEVVTVAFLEVEEESAAPADYLPEGADGPLPVWDYVWFTPATEEEDYCAGIRQAP